MFHLPFCCGNTFSDIVRHIGYVHAHHPNFNVCGIEESYRNFYREHKHIVGTENGEGVSDENPDHQIRQAADSSNISAISTQESVHKLKQNHAAFLY